MRAVVAREVPVSGVKASRGRKPRRPPRTSTCLVVYASLGAMWPRGFHGCGAGPRRAGPGRRVMTRRPELRSTSHERPDRTSEPAHGRDSSRRRGQRQPINVERERQASRRTERSSAHSSLLCLHPRGPRRAHPSPGRSPRQRRESSLQSTTTYMYISITRASTVVVSSSPRILEDDKNTECEPAKSEKLTVPT